MALRVYRLNGFSAPTRVPGGLEGAELFPTQVSSLLSSVGALPLLLQFQASLLPLPLSGVLPSGASPSVASAALQLPLPGLLPPFLGECSLPEASTTPACLSPCCAQHRPQPDQHGTGHQTVKSTATITPRISTAHSNSPQCNQAILACVWWQAGEVCSRHSPHIKLKCACLGAGSVVRLSHRGLSFHVSFGLSSSMQRLRLVWSPWSN